MCALKDDHRAGSMRSELDSPVGRKMFQLITSDWGGVSGWSHQDTVGLCCGHLCFQYIQHLASPSLSWPRSPGTLFAMSPSLKLTLWTSCHSVCLVVPQGFWTQSFGMKFNLHLVHFFFSDRVWWGHVFWHAGPRSEPLKAKNIESLKS